jgi:phosphatidylinositol glycan class V
VLRPKESIVTAFLIWKVLLLLAAIASPAPYDTSATILPQSYGFLPGKLVRWDAIWFTQVAQHGYVTEQEWAWSLGYTRLIGRLGNCVFTRGFSMSCL